jgi:RNA polymerase sigma factor (sigma-70 family)
MPIPSLLPQVRRLALPQDGAGLTDGQLLECFIADREEAALRALVKRHGPMVLGVCKRVLRNHADADDAFQATFLVLVRKAASVKPREAVVNWLYGVAYRTAMKARTTIARRQARERPCSPRALLQGERGRGEGVQMQHDAADWSELQALLDQELNALPDKYRLAVVLCDLEGKTGKQAAEQLKVPEGTVSSRLARGREMLRKRLVRRGVSLGVATLSTALAQHARASVPLGLTSSTVKAGMLLSTGKAAAGIISLKASMLAEGVVKSMLLQKLKVPMIAVLAVALAGGGLGVTRYSLTAAPGTKPEKSETSQVSAPVQSGPAPRDVKKSAESLDAVLAVAYSPDGKTLAAGVFNNSLLLFNADTGKVERVLEGSKDGFARHLAFSPDANLLAWAGDDGLRVWETKTGKVRYKPARDGRWPNMPGVGGTTVAISNEHVAWVSFPEHDELSLFDRRGELKWRFKQEKGSVFSVALSPDGKMVAGGAYSDVGIVHLWEADTGKLIRDCALSRDAPGTMNSLTFSADSKRLAGIGIHKHAHIWDVKTGRELFSMSHAEKRSTGGGCIAFSPDGRTLITGTAGPMYTRPNGRTVVSEIKVWNATTGEHIHSLEGGYDEGGSISSIAFAPDGKTFAYADFYNLIIRDAKTWEKKRELIKNRR